MLLSAACPGAGQAQSTRPAGARMSVPQGPGEGWSGACRTSVCVSGFFFSPPHHRREIHGAGLQLPKDPPGTPTKDGDRALAFSSTLSVEGFENTVSLHSKMQPLPPGSCKAKCGLQKRQPLRKGWEGPEPFLGAIRPATPVTGGGSDQAGSAGMERVLWEGSPKPW